MPAKIDWYYHRPGCVTCKRSQAFLEKAKVDIAEQVNAVKTRYPRKEALKLVREASRVIVAKGKKVVEFDLRRSPPSDEELAAAILGPSGKLRAPAIRKGATLFIGFNEEELGKTLGIRA